MKKFNNNKTLLKYSVKTGKRIDKVIAEITDVILQTPKEEYKQYLPNENIDTELGFLIRMQDLIKTGIIDLEILIKKIPA